MRYLITQSRLVSSSMLEDSVVVFHRPGLGPSEKRLLAPARFVLGLHEALQELFPYARHSEEL